MFSHILLASDGSECALKAADSAAAIAAKFDSSLTILNVYHPQPITGPFEAPVTICMDEHSIAALQDEAVCRAGHVVRGYNVKYQSRKEIGIPASEIVRFAQEEGCDLIVVGSRGLNAFQSFLIGSVSDGVTHHAHCPVLVVR